MVLFTTGGLTVVWCRRPDLSGNPERFSSAAVQLAEPHPSQLPGRPQEDCKEEPVEPGRALVVVEQHREQSLWRRDQPFRLRSGTRMHLDPSPFCGGTRRQRGTTEA